MPEAEIYAKVSKQFGDASDEATTADALSSSSSENPSGISILKYLLNENNVELQLVFALGTNNVSLSEDAVNEVLSLFVAELIDQAVGGSTGTTSGVNGNYTNYAGDEILTASELEQLEVNIPIYEQAIKETGADSYGVTWQFIASMHYKETGLSRYNPSNGQGIWQLYTYTKGGTVNIFTPSSSVNDNEFLNQTKIMLGSELLPTLENAGLDLSDEGDVKQTFSRYNGRANEYVTRALNMGFSEEEAQNGEGSPYVMNRYDAKRDPKSSEVSPYWAGVFIADGVWSSAAYSYNFGAFVVYTALSGGTSSCNGSISDGGLTEEQARAIIYDYLYVINLCDYLPSECNSFNLDGFKGVNCVTFSKYFLTRLTDDDFNGVGGGDGGGVVTHLTQEHGYEYSDAPKAYSVFSYGAEVYTGNGHSYTGIVAGIDTSADEIYILQAGYKTSPLCSTGFYFGIVSSLSGAD